MDNEDKVAEKNLVDAAIENTRKRPGRPRKKNSNIPLKVSGISETPLCPDNVMELTYENPKLFKKIFSLLKGYNVNEAIMIFNPTELKIYAQDHPGKSYIYPTVYGNMMNHYYCKETYQVPVKRDDIERIVRPFDKNHIRISLLLREDDNRSKLHMIVKDDEMDKENHITIDIKKKTIDTNTFNHDESQYPLHFTLSTKHFKREIADIHTKSDTITINKNGSDPLSMSYEGKTNCDGSYVNSDKIQLHSSISNEDMLAVNIKISQIKPFSNAAIGDNVKLYVDKFKPLCLITEIDKRKLDLPNGHTKDGYACTIKTFTELKQFVTK